MQQIFTPDASIVLIGMRGTGKSSLAMMASSALGFRIVDSDRHFCHITGQSRAAFKSAHGITEYRQQELEVMHSMLFDNRTQCVIICGPGSVEGKGQGLLRDYAKTHPIIYIMRDTVDIQRCLKLWDTETISHLVTLSGPTYRASSTFEFYNISEYQQQPTENVVTSQSWSRSPPSLTLKSLERDFLNLISSITRPASRSSKHDSKYPPSSLPPELRNFTYALSLRLSDLPRVILQLQNLDFNADAVEFIVDLPVFTDGKRTFDNSMANHVSKYFYWVRRCTQAPIIFQVQLDALISPKSSSLLEMTNVEEIYFELLEHGLRLCPEYLCVDVSRSSKRVTQLITAKCTTKIIGSYFEPHPGDDGWKSQQRRDVLLKAEDLGCDIVRLSQDAISMIDNISVQQFSYEIRNANGLHRPLIAYNTGRLGRMSCCFNSILTPVTDSQLRPSSLNFASDWLLTIQEAQNALYASYKLDGLLFYVFGLNITSSLAPSMHNAAFKFSGMPHKYGLFQCSSLEEIKNIMREPLFGGASITSPYKRDIVSFVDIMSPDARAIGAVNTLVALRSADPTSILERNRAGLAVGIYGENTDWIGIHTSINQNLSPANAVKIQTTALVLGAGGMARAAVYALIRLTVKNIFIQNRTKSRAEEVAKQFNCADLKSPSGDATNLRQTADISPLMDHTESTKNSFSVKTIDSLEESWPKDFTPPTIIVCCIPPQSVGGAPPASIKLRTDWLASKTGGVVVELAYKTQEETPLLKQVRENSYRGWIAVEGLEVLPEQGIPQFELFTGRKAPRKLMRSVVLGHQNRKFPENDDVVMNEGIQGY